jgi:hypothetical protein
VATRDAGKDWKRQDHPRNYQGVPVGNSQGWSSCSRVSQLCLLPDQMLILDRRYGHGVLRSPDPRFIALQEFCDKRPELLASPTIQLVKQTYEVAPGVLTEHGKTKNPWPNVDAASGCVLYHYGLTQFKVWRSSFSLSELELIPFTVLYGHLRCIPR